MARTSAVRRSDNSRGHRLCAASASARSHTFKYILLRSRRDSDMTPMRPRQWDLHIAPTSRQLRGSDGMGVRWCGGLMVRGPMVRCSHGCADPGGPIEYCISIFGYIALCSAMPGNPSPATSYPLFYLLHFFHRAIALGTPLLFYSGSPSPYMYIRPRWGGPYGPPSVFINFETDPCSLSSLSKSVSTFVGPPLPPLPTHTSEVRYPALRVTRGSEPLVTQPPDNTSTVIHHSMVSVFNLTSR